jgi:predicted Mrr-cat superfamily restriction endonuclease
MKYWKIAPGEKGFLWVEQRDANCIAVGWSNIGDLNKYERKELEEEFKKKYPKSEPNQLLRFYKDVSQNDKVVASSGKFVYGIGTVVGDYLYDKNLVYEYSKPVRWELTFWEPLNIEELSLSQNLKKRLNLNRTILELKSKE